MTDTPLSDDVVERVARAMFDHEWAPSDAKIRDGVWRDEAHSGYFIEAARAALEAARYGELVKALRRAEQFIRGLTMTDAIIMASTLETEADAACALLSSIGAAQ